MLEGGGILRHVTWEDNEKFDQFGRLSSTIIDDPKTIATHSSSYSNFVKMREQSFNLDKTIDSQIILSNQGKNYNSFNLLNDSTINPENQQFVRHVQSFQPGAKPSQQQTAKSPYSSLKMTNIYNNGVNNSIMDKTVQSSSIVNSYIEEGSFNREQSGFSLGKEFKLDNQPLECSVFDKSSVNDLFEEFDSNFEKICKEKNFEEINKEILSFFEIIPKIEEEFLFEPDLFDENIYNCQESQAICQSLIGSGGYGSVFDFVMKNQKVKEDNEKVVGKTFFLNQSNKNDFYFNFNSFMKELKILHTFNHENIINCLGMFYRINSNDELQNIGIFLEKMRFNLKQYLKEMKGMLTYSDLLDITLQISKGVQYIHRNNRIHRDIKVNNILVEGYKNKVKIIDFGTISENMLSKNLIMDDAFTLSYAPPEFIRYYYLNEQVPLNFGSDIWSLGVTFFEIFCFEKEEAQIRFPWLKIISDFEMREFDLEQLTQKLKSKKYLVLETEEDSLKKLIKKDLKKHIKKKN